MPSSVEYPRFNDKERAAAMSAVKKLAQSPVFRDTAGDIVLATNIGREVPQQGLPTVQPTAAEPPSHGKDASTTLSQPRLSLEEWRVVARALPALKADGRLSDDDAERYEVLCKSQKPSVREFGAVNRRFFLGWSAFLGGSYLTTEKSVELTVSSYTKARQIHKKVDAYMQGLYQNDPRDLRGRPANTPEELKADVGMKNERKQLTEEMLTREGLPGAREGISFGLLANVVASFISIVGTAVFLDNFMDKIQEWKGRLGKFRIYFYR